MGLLKPKRRPGRPIRPYTTLHCVVARNQVGWCRALCTPLDGHGACGRVAPHSLRGRTQTAIANYKRGLRRDDDGS